MQWSDTGFKDTAYANRSAYSQHSEWGPLTILYARRKTDRQERHLQSLCHGRSLRIIQTNSDVLWFRSCARSPQPQIHRSSCWAEAPEYISREISMHMHVTYSSASINWAMFRYVVVVPMVHTIQIQSACAAITIFVSIQTFL